MSDPLEEGDSSAKLPIPSFAIPSSNVENSNDDWSLEESNPSSDEEEDSSPMNAPHLSLQERAERNRLRNELFLQSLDERYGRTSITAKPSRPRTQNPKAAPAPVVAKGMLRKSKNPKASTPHSSVQMTWSQRIASLQQKYPHRETPIRQLAALFHATVASTSSPVPAAPVWVVGPPGTAKSSILRDLLSHFAQASQTTSSTEKLLTAYLNCSILEPLTPQRLVLEIDRQLRSQADSVSPTPIPTETSQPKESPSKKTKTAPVVHPIPSQGHRQQPQRTVKVQDSQTAIRTAVAGATANPGKTSVESFCPVTALGRRLAIRLQGRAAILVLDNAECLVALQQSLADMLWLPRIYRLPILVVVVSQFSLLSHTHSTRLERSNASLSATMAWRTVQFPAYSSREQLMEILQSDSVLPCIVGNRWARESSDSYKSQIVQAFLHALVQMTSQQTRSIPDFIRVGRSLWPVFLEPFRKHPSVKPPLPVQDMSRNFFGRMNKTPEFFHSATPPVANTDLDLPLLRRILLLAAFICQHNRADRDAAVFSIQGKGKRRRTDHPNREEAQEDPEKQLKSIRPRPFLMERFLSIFYTLVKLNPQDSCGPVELTDINHHLRQLVDLGYVHPATSSRNEPIALGASKFWCSLTQPEAIDLAKQVDIPLENYLV